MIETDMLTVHAYTMEKFCDLVNAYFYLLEDYSMKDYVDITSEIRHHIREKKHEKDFNDTLRVLVTEKLNQSIDILNALGYHYDHVSWSGHDINQFTCHSFISLYHHP